MNKVQVIEQRGQRVLTTKQIAQGYEAVETQIKQNFNNHKDRFIEGKHYFLLTGQALRVFKNQVDNIDLVPKHTSSLYLWTEKGALRHAKILDTDKAWEVYEELEETYFRVRDQKPLCIEDVLIRSLEEMKAMRMELEVAKEEVATTKETVQHVKETLLMQDTHWRKDVQTMLNRVAKNSMMNFQGTRSESYKLLEGRARCNLSVRVTNIKHRLRDTGATKTQVNKVCKLDAIEGDTRLKEIYTSIVKEMVIKFVA